MPQEIRYSRSLVMLSYHDAEWSRQEYNSSRDWRDLILRCQANFRESADEYRTLLTQNFQNFVESNKKASGREPDPRQSARWSAPFDSSLYNPQFFLPLGHSDLLTLMLADDFDPLQHIAARMKTTLEGMSIGFIPEPASIGVKATDTFYCRLEDICRRETPSPTSTQPLLVFTKMKVDGLACLGLGLAFQARIWQTIVARMRDLFEAMRRDSATVEDFAIKEEDIASTQCALIDLQGCEEVGLLVFTRNLSVAVSIVSGLCHLTYGDAYEDNREGSLESLLDRSRVHTQLLKFARQNPARASAPIESNSAAIRHNHIFKWTHSSVALRIARDVDPKSERLLVSPDLVRGHVWAASRLQVSPGHFTATDRLESSKAGERGAAASFRFSGPRMQQFCVGLYDKIFQHKSVGLSNFYSGAIPFGDVIENVESTLRALCHTKPDIPWVRDIVDIETELIVPIPDLRTETGEPLINVEIKPTQFAPLLSALPPLIRQLCDGSAAGARSDGAQSGGADRGALDIDGLMGALRKLGVPVSVRRTVEYLFRNFSIVTADPFTFDTFLDLYDTFATLHGLFTKHLGELPLADATGSDGESRSLLDGVRIARVSEFLNALQNTMSHRTAYAFRDPARRDMSVHLRGGLNQIFSAVDAPLKCGLGVLRRLPRGHKTETRARNSVGCVMQIGTIPGARCKKVYLGTERDCRLAYFEIDVPHILHVASYVDVLHEAFHLVFDEARLWDDGLKTAMAACPRDDRCRFEELFVLTLTMLFVFGEDREIFLYHSVFSFSRGVTGVGRNDKVTVMGFNEILVRLFLVTDRTHDRHGDPRFWDPSYPADVDITAARERFESMVTKAGPFFSEFQRLWQRDERDGAWTRMVQHFDHVYARFATNGPVVWEAALRVYQWVSRRLAPDLNVAQVEDTIANLGQIIRNAFAQGQPVAWSDSKSWSKGIAGLPNDSGECNLEGEFLDPMLFVCRLLYHYIEPIKKAIGQPPKHVHLRRTRERADATFPTDAENWEFLADKGAAALFSCVPVARAERLSRQIVVLKSLWGLSAELKARRLREMLDSVGR